MRICPNELRTFYGFLRTAKAIKEFGLDIKIDKKAIFVPIENNSRDMKFNENEEIVRFTQRSVTTGLDYLMSQTRELLSAKIKNAGFAKVGTTSRYDLVCNETKKNAVFVASDLNILKNFFSSCNAKLTQADREKNTPFMTMLTAMCSDNMFNYSYFNTTSFSRLSNLNREFTINIPNRSSERMTLRYCYGKFKHYMHGYESTNSGERVTEYLSVVFKYIDYKEKSKELFFNIGEKSVSLYDMVFLPGTETVESVNAGNRLIVNL